MVSTYVTNHLNVVQPTTNPTLVLIEQERRCATALLDNPAWTTPPPLAWLVSRSQPGFDVGFHYKSNAAER